MGYLNIDLQVLFVSGPSLDICFADIFLYSVACLFTSLAVSFEIRSLSFDQVQFINVFLLLLMLLLLYLKRFLSSPRSQRFTPVVSCKNFIVLTFMFRSFLFYILRSFLLKV